MTNLRDSIAADIRDWEEDHLVNTKNYTAEELATRSYREGRLRELKKIYLKYRVASENRNDIALVNLKNKVDLMEKHLFRSIGVRLMVRLKDSIRFRGYIKRVKEEQAQMYDTVRSFVSQTNLYPEYMPKIVPGAREITIPNTSYHQMSPTEIMSYDFDLTANGEGLNTTYKVRILSIEDPSTVKEVKFKHRSHKWLNREQVYNLASGESVLHVDHNGNEKWMKLNPLDRDKDGYSQLIQVSGEDFNVKESLQASVLKVQLTESAESHLVKKLKNGNVVDIKIPQKNGSEKIFKVQADPLRRTLNITEKPGTDATARKENKVTAKNSTRNTQVTARKRAPNKKPTAGKAGKNLK